MSESKSNRREFWDGKYGGDINAQTMKKRPSRILHFKLKRICSMEGCSYQEAIKHLVKLTGLEASAIRRIVTGGTPTSVELGSIIRGLNWSYFFVFGVSFSGYEEKETAFFKQLGVDSPAQADKEAFRELYDECLRQLSEDEEGGCHE